MTFLSPGVGADSSAAASAKAAKKAEAQAKFEQLRSEQIAKMALAKAEVQRRAEAAKNGEIASAPQPQPQGRLGKLGAKFTEAVLFPAPGGGASQPTWEW